MCHTTSPSTVKSSEQRSFLPGTSELLHDGQGCGVQYTNLGTSFSAVGQCLAVALNTAGCGRAVMWSTTYNQDWGCRCCTNGGFDGGDVNSNWTVWGVVVTNTPTNAPTRAPTNAPTNAPTTSCFNVDSLSTCMSMHTNSKYHHGCRAYTYGSLAGNYTCFGCGTVSRNYAPCDLNECRLFCDDLAGNWSGYDINLCKTGCLSYQPIPTSASNDVTLLGGRILSYSQSEYYSDSGSGVITLLSDGEVARIQQQVAHNGVDSIVLETDVDLGVDRDDSKHPSYIKYLDLLTNTIKEWSGMGTDNTNWLSIYGVANSNTQSTSSMILRCTGEDRSESERAQCNPLTFDGHDQALVIEVKFDPLGINGNCSWSKDSPGGGTCGSNQWQFKGTKYLVNAVGAATIEAGAIMQVVYSAGTTATSSNTGAISVASGVTYRIVMHVLRNDLGSASERVTGVTFNGHSIGACNPDGGDYDCTFYNCNSELTRSTYTATSDTINVDLTYTGHSYDCDCDVNDWSCSSEGTVVGRTAMTAVAQFILIPIISGK